MGAWGYGPFENDGACDFRCELFRARNWRETIGFLQLNLNKVSSRSRGYEEARAAAAIVMMFGIDTLATKAVRVVAIMLHDNKWIASWERPSAIRRSLHAQLHNLSFLGTSASSGGSVDYRSYGRLLKRRLAARLRRRRKSKKETRL